RRSVGMGRAEGGVPLTIRRFCHIRKPDALPAAEASETGSGLETGRGEEVHILLEQGQTRALMKAALLTKPT
ncbi:hypothetical protein, partial [Streptomyces hirsutus]|uniref:hypothetical protein n=1 Tax=Streptomyces hirsutus TaxID=35620 RepID=UPI003330B553